MATETTVVVEKVGETKKRLTITIPADVVTRKIEEAYAAVRADAQIPGFRRGLAPVALIEKRFGEAIINDARQQLVSEAYGKALQDHKIEPIGEPELAEGHEPIEVARGKAINLRMELEVVPEFALPALEEIEVKRPVTDIAEKYVHEELRRMGYQMGTPARIDGDFTHLDRMLGKAVVRVKGAAQDPFFETEQCLVVVPDAEDEGKGQVLGLLIDGLTQKLLGRKVGETIVIQTKGPEAHEREELRNADITIELTPAQAERIAPASAESLAEMLGMGSVDNLKDQVRLSLEARRDQEQRAAMREQAADWLLEKVDFPLPERLKGAEVARNIEMSRMQLLQQGLADEEIERRLAEIRSSSETQARRRLKLFFVLARLAQQFEVGVSDSEVNGAVVQMARARNLRPDAVRAELQKSGRLNEVALDIRNAKTLDRVLDQAKVTDIDAEAWNKLVTEKQAAEAGKAKAGGKPSK